MESHHPTSIVNRGLVGDMGRAKSLFLWILPHYYTLLIRARFRTICQQRSRTIHSKSHISEYLFIQAFITLSIYHLKAATPNQYY
jgi:hypothetical protein